MIATAAAATARMIFFTCFLCLQAINGDRLIPSSLPSARLAR